MVDFAVHAVLPAGGCGQRMELSMPKQFCLIHGRPLISYTIQAFEKADWILSITVVVSADHMDLTRQLLDEWGHSAVRVRLAEAGTTRHRSIWNGVKTASSVCPPDGVIIIHDAVRPFVDEDILQSVAMAARNYGAAGAIRKLVSTVIATDDEGFLDHSLDRSKYRASEMPQAFQCQVIKNAYEKCSDYDFDYGTECLHLALKYSNCKAKLVEGPDSLWKITHRKDLYAAEGVVAEEITSVSILGDMDEKIKSSLVANLDEKSFEFQLFPLVFQEPGDENPQRTIQEGGNNFIIFHPGPSPSQILHLHKTHSVHAKKRITAVHVFTFSEKNADSYSGTEVYLEVLRNDFLTKLNNLCCCAVILKTGFDADGVGHLISTLLSSNNHIFKSQVFVL